MKYSNPKIPESDSPRQKAGASVREFGKLAAGFVAVMILGGFLVFKGGSLLGKLIPFDWEARLFTEATVEVFGKAGDAGTEARLQELADRLSVALEMPENMPITIHYRETEMVNAFATFHGHIVILSGLLRQLETENAVAALLAHEIGHVKNRHLAQNLSGGIFASLFYGALVGDSSPLAAPGSHLLQLELASFSRQMEAESDQAALAALQALYGHIGGYNELFLVLDREKEKAQNPFFKYYDSHPATSDRSKAALAFSQKNGIALGGRSIPWQRKK